MIIKANPNKLVDIVINKANQGTFFFVCSYIEPYTTEAGKLPITFKKKLVIVNPSHLILSSNDDIIIPVSKAPLLLLRINTSNSLQNNMLDLY